MAIHRMAFIKLLKTDKAGTHPQARILLRLVIVASVLAVIAVAFYYFG